jgi:hypothetical protein
MSLRRQACVGASIAVVALTSPGWAVAAASVKPIFDTAVGKGLDYQ